MFLLSFVDQLYLSPLAYFTADVSLQTNLEVLTWFFIFGVFADLKKI